MGGRQMMTLQTYLIHFRDRQLALAVGAELEDRLARDGRQAVALIPAGDGLGLARADGGGRGASRGSYGAPQVVALYEEGLLATLESLGLTAYVGVCPEEEAQVVRWGSGGAMLLPVTTARDLVGAIAGHTPWAAHAARMAKFASSWRAAGMPGPARPALSRKLAVAGIAGPLLLTGVPATAAAAAPGLATHQPSARAGVTALLAAKIRPPQTKTTQPALPPDAQAFLNQIESALLYYLRQTGQATSGNAQAATQALENQITRLINGLLNAQPKTSPQPAQPAQPAQAATAPQGANPAPTNAGSQGPMSSGSQNSPGSQGPGSQQSPGAQDQSQQNPQDQNPQDQSPQDQSQQNPDSQSSSTSQGSTSRQGSTASGGSTTASGSTSTSAGGGTSSSGGGTSLGGSTS